ncbi:MAG: cytochrome c oxidase subunit II [Actinomycetota bacterium]
MTSSRRKIVLPTGAGLMLGMCACAPEASDVQGGAVRDLYGFFFIVASGVFLIVVGLISWSLIRYREKPADGLPKQFHTNIKLEILWFAIPQALVIALFIFSLATLGDTRDAPAEPELTVRVEGFRWGWRFTYVPEDVVLNSEPERPAELVLPVGERIEFELLSDDVIHSFYVPSFLIKRDTIPGEVNHLSVTLEEEGTFRGVCAEFCGLLHDQMNFTVRAVPGDSFESWLSEQETP